MSAALPERARIDVHVHLGGIGACGSGISVSSRFRRGLVFRILMRSVGIGERDAPRADELYVERVARLVREARHVDAAVVLALDGRWREGELDRERSPLVVPNEWASEAARTHPELLFGASVSPLRPDALDELDRVADQGAVLVKWLPNVMGIDPSDAAHRPFYRRLADLGLPLLSHSGAEFTLPGGDHRLGGVRRLRRALDEGVCVIAAHAGTLSPGRDETGRWRSGPELLARLAEEHPRLHADLSALTSPARGWSLGRILDDERLRGRLLEASDFPVPSWPWTQLSRIGLRRVLAARRLRNPFDRDRQLKRDAGVTEEIELRATRVLRLP